MVKHRPYLNPEEVCRLYSEKDGVKVTYVCSTELKPRQYPMDVFFRETPHPEFGNRYFGIYIKEDRKIMIANADGVEDLTFDCIEGPEGWEYSNATHDFRWVGGGCAIDGGRSYTRRVGDLSGEVKTFRVKDGVFAPDINQVS